jgi:hypothetical protein
MFNPGAPCCECKGPSTTILATKKMGSGYIVLCSCVLSTMGGAGGTGYPNPFSNPELWLNIRNLGGGGPVGAVADAGVWAQNMVSAWPTVSNVNTGAALAGIKVLYSGLVSASVLGGTTATQVVPMSMWTAVRDWVKAGNVLVVFCQPVLNGTIGADFESINRMFRSFGVGCRFTNELQDSLGPNNPLNPYSGTPVPHWLNNGTLGYPMCGLWHYQATGICGADPVFLAGNDPTILPSCNGPVFTKCCPDTPLSRTVLLTTERGTIAPTVLTYTPPTQPLGFGTFGWGAPADVNIAGSTGPQHVFVELSCGQNSGTPGVMGNFSLTMNFLFSWRPTGYTGIIGFGYFLDGPGNSCSPLTFTQDIEYGISFGNAFTVLDTDTIHISG